MQEKKQNNHLQVPKRGQQSTAFVNRSNEVKLNGLAGNFPDWMIDNLKQLDIGGSGILTQDDMERMCLDIRKLKVNQISNCADIDYSVFPKAAQDVFKGWDTDNTGYYYCQVGPGVFRLCCWALRAPPPRETLRFFECCAL